MADQPYELANIPDFTKTFHTITQPEADKSKGILLQTAATGLEEGAKTVDTYFKNKINSDVQESVNKYRDPFIGDLSELRNAMYGGGGADQSLIPAEKRSDTPPQLQNDISRVQQLGAAIGAGGHANDTLYWGRMYAEAKRIRNANPGYTNEVDDAFRQATGRDPANALMSNLLEDINRGMAGRDKELDATRAILRGLAEKGWNDGSGTTASQLLEGLDSGRLTHLQVMNIINRSMKTDFEISNRARDLNDKKVKGEDTLIDAKKSAADIARQIAANNWNTMTIGKGTDTPETMIKFMEHHAGEAAGTMSDQDARSYGQQLNMMYNKTANQIKKKLYDSGFLDKFGGDESLLDQTVDSALGKFKRAIHDVVFNKDWGAAYSHMNFNEAIAHDTANVLYNDRAAGADYTRKVGALNSIGGPQFAAEFFKQFLIGDMPESEREWLKNKELEFLTQPFSAPKSVQQAIQEGQNKGVTSPKTFDHMINQVNRIADPKTPEAIRVNAARAFFDPVLNEGLLSDDNFKRDYTDAKGRQVPGKYSVWNRLSSDGVSAGMKELMKTHPEFRQWYPQMMEKEFGEQLWGRELKDMSGLDAVSRLGAYKIKFSHGAGVDQPPRFDILTYKGQPVYPTYKFLGPLGPSLEGVKNRLNSGISGLWNIYKSTGEKDPTAHILETMHKYGLSSGITSDIFNTSTKASVEEMAQPPEAPISGGEK